jgi:radical SAM protein with 4Fe4S-binding SPASM domain
MVLSDRDPGREWHHMDPQLFRRIEEQVFPLAETVGLSCGAEPFCNPDFGHYLARLHRADVPVREVVTNGTLLTGENIEYLVRTPPTTLFVSIDGAEGETHAKIRGGADLEAVLSGLALLKERRGRSRFPMIAFSTTLQQSNWRELPGIVELAVETGAESVGVVLLVPYSGLDRTGEVVDTSDPEVAGTIRRAGDVATKAGVELVLPSGDKGSVDSCGFVDSWVYIDPDGKVNPCPHWNTSEPLGDIRTQDFRDIMDGPAYTALRDRLKKGQLQGNCAVCPELSNTPPGEPTKV